MTKVAHAYITPRALRSVGGTNSYRKSFWALSLPCGCM